LNQDILNENGNDAPILVDSHKGFKKKKEVSSRRRRDDDDLVEFLTNEDTLMLWAVS
jgi:hypothetical protein